MRINVEEIVRDVDVKVEQGQIVLTGRLGLSIPLPSDRVPDPLEDDVEQVGQTIKRVLLGAFLEQADREEVLRNRQGRGGKGIQPRGIHRGASTSLRDYATPCVMRCVTVRFGERVTNWRRVRWTTICSANPPSWILSMRKVRN